MAQAAQLTESQMRQRNSADVKQRQALQKKKKNAKSKKSADNFDMPTDPSVELWESGLPRELRIFLDVSVLTLIAIFFMSDGLTDFVVAKIWLPGAPKYRKRNIKRAVLVIVIGIVFWVGSIVIFLLIIYEFIKEWKNWFF